MTVDTPPFRFEYDAGTIQYGAGRVAELASELERLGVERAMIVCGSTVGSTPEVIDPVRTGLGETLAAVFDETTPEKRLDTAFEGRDLVREQAIDVLVSLGGGSSLDVATAISALAASDRTREEIAAAFVETGRLSVPDDPLVPIVAVPTTLAGADLSTGGGINAFPDTVGVDAEEPVYGGVSNPRLMPSAVFYDPELVATTPRRILAGSAMNGFDKGIETLYARNATPITDSTAMRGLELLRRGLPALGRGERDDRTMHEVVTGTMLVQYGISRPDGSTLSLIHAFGHGLSRDYDLQQGAAHAIVAPHALRYLFEQVHARRDLIARGLGVEEDDPDAVADGIVDRVATIRDALGLPSQLRTVDGLERDDLPTVARATFDDRLMANVPDDMDPTVGDLERVLDAAW